MRRRVLILLSLSISACNYSWAFGEDIGAPGLKLFAGSVCTQELAKALYTPEGKEGALSSFDNQFFYPGKPGQMYWVHGFRSEASCEAARQKVAGTPRPNGLQGNETRY